MLQIAYASVLGNIRILDKHRENLIGRMKRRWSEQVVLGVFFAFDRAVTAIFSAAGTGRIFSVPPLGLTSLLRERIGGVAFLQSWLLLLLLL